MAIKPITGVCAAIGRFGQAGQDANDWTADAPTTNRARPLRWHG